MKTVEEIVADWQRSREELAAREDRFRERRRRFNQRAVIASAIMLALSFRAQAWGGSYATILWLLTPGVGALAAWPIVHWRLGPLRSAPVFMTVTMGWELLVLSSGGFSAQPSQVGDAVNPGPALIMVCSWVLWTLYGILLGLTTAQEEDDTVQI